MTLKKRHIRTPVLVGSISCLLMKLWSQCATSFFDAFCLLAQVLVAELHKFSGSNTFFRDLVKQDMFENQHSSWISRNCSFPAYCKKSLKSNCAMSCCDIYVPVFVGSILFLLGSFRTLLEVLKV